MPMQFADDTNAPECATLRNLRRSLDDALRMPQAVVFIIAGSFIVSVARATSLTFVAIILHRDFDMELAGIGLIVGTGPLLGAVCAPIVGAWSDRIGRKAVLAVVLGMLSMSITAMGLAGGAFLCGIAYTIAAISITVFGPISRAIISDVSQERDRLIHYSWRYTASNLGWTIGPIISVAAGPTTLTGFLIAGAIVAVLLLVLVFVKLPVPDQTPVDINGLSRFVATIKGALRDRRLFSLICGSALALSVYGHWSVTMGPYLMSKTANGPETYAILISINGIVVLLANPVVRRMIARTGGLPGLLAGCVILCASQIGFASSTALPALITSMALLSIAEVLVVLAEFVLVDKLVSGPSSGSYFGAHAISHVGNFLGAIIGGLTLAAFGGPPMFLLFALIAIASAFIYSLAFRTPR